MKKIMFIFFVLTLVFSGLFFSCKKNNTSSPSAPTAVNTIDPHYTVTQTMTQTCTSTATQTSTAIIPTATPQRRISAWIYSPQDGDAYCSINVSENLTPVTNAVVKVNGVLTMYSGGYYNQSGPLPLTPGAQCVVNVDLNGNTYSASVTIGGGNISIIGDVISYVNEGNYDYVLVRDYSFSTIYLDTRSGGDISSGYVISPSVFTNTGMTYNIYVVVNSKASNTFTGYPALYSSDIAVQASYYINEAK